MTLKVALADLEGRHICKRSLRLNEKQKAS